MKPEGSEALPNSLANDQPKQVCRVKLPDARCYEGSIDPKQPTEPENDHQLSTTEEDSTAEAPINDAANTPNEPQGGEEVTVATGNETNNVETVSTTAASNTQSNQAVVRSTYDRSKARELRAERNFRGLCYRFRNEGFCERGSFCRYVHVSAPEGTGAQSTEHPMDVYFAQYPEFDHQFNKPYFEEFDRMCSHFNWDDDDASAPWHLFRIAFVQEFNYVYGDDENDLLLWQKMFKIIGLAEPATLSEARQIMRVTRVNLVDMTEAPRTGIPVQRFKTLDLLREYSYKEDKIFPKVLAYAGGMLKMLLRELDNQYGGRRLGGSELNKMAW
ncbi:hypothetical protein NW762_002764 [Fusarium torreyae]|uniref:C3H1-type domain-containing protein n=1 Tax=Fusarium torreyae TaxID=1237075 RepID=A0A9W8SDJ7_9HYPO|nr:hypothetical protein NW762_002764 [Fusarium torreyae]